MDEQRAKDGSLDQDPQAPPETETFDPFDYEPQDEEKVIFVISAQSGGFNDGDYGHISINHEEVEMDLNENGHHRGLHIVVINPSNGRVEKAKVFDTYESSEAVDEFIKQRIPPGHIVVAACKDECTNKLSDAVKEWFAKMGAVGIRDLRYRQGFAFIGVSGQHQATDRRSLQAEPASVTQIFQVTSTDYMPAADERLGRHGRGKFDQLEDELILHMILQLPSFVKCPIKEN